MEQLNNLFMFLKQGKFQYAYVCQYTLHFKLCKRKGKSQFEEILSFFYLAWYLKLENGFT